MVLLEATGLSFSYTREDGTAYPVLKDFSLSLDEGESLVILGPSGCGKSTLLKILGGFLRSRTGEVLYRGRRVEKPFRRGQMVFQDPQQLLPWLTVEENMIFPERRGRVPKAARDSLLEKVGIEEFRESYTHQLSGGMKQRAALARALFALPELLFMDEPFVSLDAPSRQELQEMVLKLWKDEGLSLLFVTHDVGEALFLADRILIMGRDYSFTYMANPLPYPRERWSESFLREEIRIHSLLEASRSSR